ncbi:putative Zn(2)-C6 fungal-type domain-containing protein [Seiridium unicorne]|uniref:Zn(2)-C6 fungal-type domain-containing protein n=1 Tax=Seiridium unicorne TaxID=138068 RepID=A0ABR2UM13_9PEZI
MPYKSKELFHYFHQFGSGEMELESSAADCLSLAITDRHALRGTLLIAGLHYSWNVGNLETFQAAFLFHKLEIIRNLNGRLECADRETVMLCVRQICTLCLSEVCFGNIAAAQAHLDGLMKFLDVAEKRNLASVDADDTDTELANRYIILTSNFLHILKSRLNDFVLLRDENGASPFWDKFSPYALDLMHKWHKIEHRGLENRLKAMRMLPHFFCPITTTRKSTKINGRPAMDSITQMTNAVDRRNGNSGSKYDNRVWNDGAPNQLFVDYVHGHMSSFSEEDMTSPYSLSRGNGGSECLPSSWGGVAAAGGLYMQSVLNVANVEEPIDPRLIRRLVMIIKRDMDHNVNDMRGQHGKALQDFWFWKSFVAALALAINKRDLERRKAPWPAISEEGAWSLQSILRLMESRIRVEAAVVLYLTKDRSEAGVGINDAAAYDAAMQHYLGVSGDIADVRTALYTAKQEVGSRKEFSKQ